VVVLLSALLLQTAWILALPAFRGIDEFDHVYKAESIAHGQLLDQGSTETGRGALLTVPAGTVVAASATCDSLPYTGRGNCHPVQRLGNGPGVDMVTVASGAATYNPAYYAVAGLMARPFSGAAVDFALRAVTALLAALLLAWAAAVTARWASNAWPLLALLVSVTPVLVYSTAIASPNGIGYAAACLLWAAGLGLVEDPRRPRLVAVTVAALVVLATHTTGVMWLALVLVVLAVVQPARRWRDLWRGSTIPLVRSAVVVALGGLACGAWIIVARTNALTPPTEDLGRLPLGDLVSSQLLWTLQTVAAFPMRNERPPVVVYALWLVPFLGLMIAGLRRSTRRLRLTVLALAAGWVAVPILLTVVSYSSIGLAWQGRYALPLAVGFPALAGLALSRAGRGPRPLTAVVTVALCAIAQVISCVAVAWKSADHHLAPAFPAAVPGGFVVVGALALLGGLLPLLLARAAPLAQVTSEPLRTNVTAGAAA
jgi:hypothetical protein